MMRAGTFNVRSTIPGVLPTAAGSSGVTFGSLISPRTATGSSPASGEDVAEDRDLRTTASTVPSGETSTSGFFQRMSPPRRSRRSPSTVRPSSTLQEEFPVFRLPSDDECPVRESLLPEVGELSPESSVTFR